LLDNKQIGNNLKLAREKIGANKRQFATVAGVDVSQYGRVERGDEGFGREKLIQIAERHGLNMEFLSTGKGPIFVETDIAYRTIAPISTQVLTSEQVFSILATGYQTSLEIMKAQTAILETIKKEMARADGQAEIDKGVKDIAINLNVAQADIEKISLVQDRMEKVLDYLAEITAGKTPPSKGLGKQKHEIDGDGKKPGK